MIVNSYSVPINVIPIFLSINVTTGVTWVAIAKCKVGKSVTGCYKGRYYSASMVHIIITSYRL